MDTKEKKTGIKPEEIYHPFIKKMYRKMGDMIARKVINTRITPNQITIFSFLIIVISAYFFFRADYISIIVGAILLQFYWILDHADGSLARMRDSQTLYGYWLDTLAGTYGYVLVYLGATLGIYNQIHEPHILVFGFLAPIAILIKNLTQNFYLTKCKSGNQFGQKMYKKFGFLMFFRPTGSFITIIFTISAIFNQMYLLLIFLGIYNPLYIIMQNIILALRIKKEKDQTSCFKN